MKRLIILLTILILPLSLNADMNTYIIGSGTAAGGGCTNDTIDQYYDGGTAAAGMGSTARAQSFQVSETADYRAISVRFNHNGTDGDIECRVSAGTDMTSYLATKTETLTEDGWVKFIFATPIQLSSSTTYYLGVRNAADNNIACYVNTSGTYANGNHLYSSEAGSPWNLNQNPSNWDMDFRVHKCSE